MPKFRDRKEYNKAWRDAHKEHLKAYDKNRKNKAERYEARREYYIANKERLTNYNRDYQKSHKEQLKEYERKRYDKRHEYRLTYFRRLKDTVLRAYGGVCKCCGEDQLEFLSIDHINNDGALHRKESNCGGGSSFYLWLKRHGYPTYNFQVLCFNCNYAKHRYGLCPHQRVIGGEVGA